MIREALDAALAFSLMRENVHNIIEKKNEILRGGDIIVSLMYGRMKLNHRLILYMRAHS